MTEPVLPEPVPPNTPDHTDRPVPPEEAETAEPTAKAELSKARRWATGRRSRLVAAGAAVVVVVVGGTVLATAAVVRHQGERFGVRAVAVGPAGPVGPDGLPGLPGVKRVMVGAPDGPLGSVVVKGSQAMSQAVPGGAGTRLAPAPLPSLPADQAAQKAAATVSGGKVESLEPVPEQGGGTAWQVTVLGPDGIRHLITLDGTSGTVTGNTVVDG
ncbi:hypothetical protein [Streptacidiphilus cavernicola]|uniref:PepSY domain-containing protein n=1 Tax=Streptacidiphilus cavernicola TaxID=3342716 RepID=A0ABV6VZW9_9ACTN